MYVLHSSIWYMITVAHSASTAGFYIDKTHGGFLLAFEFLLQYLVCFKLS